MTIRTENNTTDVNLFAGAVNRLVGSDMRQIALGAARIAGDLWRPKRTGPLPAEDESRGDEQASDGGGLKHVIELREASTLAVQSDAFHRESPSSKIDDAGFDVGLPASAGNRRSSLEITIGNGQFLGRHVIFFAR